MKNKTRGFTLIELLTVIMIIGILAGVILVSMETARQRAADVNIQTQVGQLRSLAEALYTFEDHYREFKEASESGRAFLRIKEEVQRMNDGEGGFEIFFSDGESPRSYCMYAYLVRNPNEIMCYDSSGDAVKEVIGSGIGEVAAPSCTATNVSCTASGGSGPECITWEDCASGLDCVGGVCVDPE